MAMPVSREFRIVLIACIVGLAFVCVSCKVGTPWFLLLARGKKLEFALRNLFHPQFLGFITVLLAVIGHSCVFWYRRGTWRAALYMMPTTFCGSFLLLFGLFFIGFGRR